VQKDVTLQHEKVTVDRRPVDRPASEADLGAFQEGTIEVTEKAEMPVVEKQARVVEEVVVGKDVHEHQQTVQDTVRRKDVEVEQMPGTTTQMGAGNWDEYNAEFQAYHKNRYGTNGNTYMRYEPAYRYGYTLAND